jgi:hypothetical protein
MTNKKSKHRAVTPLVYDCYDCDGILPTREERKAGERHECKKKARAPWDWTCELDYAPGSGIGAIGGMMLIGEWTLEIRDADGKTVKGTIADVRSCLRLAQMQGFSRRRIVPSDRAADKLGWRRR